MLKLVSSERTILVVVLSLLSACAADAPETDEVEATDGGKSDGASELSVHVSNTTVWVSPTLERSGDAFVMHGRTSRDITYGDAFVADDVYGAFTFPTAQTFEVSWP